jgi:hypothetical protein
MNIGFLRGARPLPAKSPPIDGLSRPQGQCGVFTRIRRPVRHHFIELPRRLYAAINSIFSQSAHGIVSVPWDMFRQMRGHHPGFGMGVMTTHAEAGGATLPKLGLKASAPAVTLPAVLALAAFAGVTTRCCSPITGSPTCSRDTSLLRARPAIASPLNSPGA